MPQEKLTGLSEQEVITAEHEHIANLREDNMVGRFWGLALSGGGIRSASFSLGVLQALAKAKKLSRFDYLSTVSGGGYIGTSLSWFIRRGRGGARKFTASHDNFPFGSVAGRRGAGAHESDRVLNFIRQNASYLIPGRGINMLSLFAVAMRGIFVSLFVYGTLLFFAMKVLKKLCLLTPTAEWTPGGTKPIASALTTLINNAPTWLVTFLGWIDAAIKYAATTVTPLKSLPLSLALAVVLVAMLVVFAVIFALSLRRSYARRVWTQRWIGVAWGVIIVLAIIGSLPLVGPHAGAWISGALTGTGTIGGFFSALRKSAAGKKAGTLSRLIPQLAAGALTYGLVLGAWLIVERFDASGVSRHTAHWVYLGVAASGLLVGFFSNLNSVGHHRMYRDRLMELFMPDDATVKSGQWQRATAAQNYSLTELACNRPYHLINTNVVLIDSGVRRYRDRGGDSFVLSGLHCGSTATDWWRTFAFTGEEEPDCTSSSKSKSAMDDMHTSQFIRLTNKAKKAAKRFPRARRITLASAMAISAAAADPNTGAGGRGPTRGRLVSALMTLLNIRLGYWIVGRDGHYLRANMLQPGLRALFGLGFREDYKFLELTDGGHFDNTGVYELLRRKVALIVLADGSADPKFRFGDLANVIERARVDFGVKIRFDDDLNIDGLLPGSAPLDPLAKKFELAERGYALAKITYDEKREGHLLYIKTTLTPDLPADVYGYRADNPTFPDQSTGDQFFNERQFEAYRELGYQLAQQALGDPEIQKVMPWSPSSGGEKKAPEKNPDTASATT